MSNTNDYIITTLASGSQEYTNAQGCQITPQAPFSIGIPTGRSVRLTGAPYVLTKGNASQVFNRQQISTQSGIPDSIVQGENLQHWWRLNEGSTSYATDYGLRGGSPTQMSFVDAAIENNGPSAIGIPSYVKFNGTSAYGKAAIVDTSNNDTGINTTLTNTNFTICFWVQNFYKPSDPPQPVDNATPIFAASSEASESDGVGSWYRGYSSDWYFYVADKANGQNGIFHTGSNAGGVTRVESNNTWVHMAMVLEEDAAQLRTYVNGVLRFTRSTQNSPTGQVAGNTGNFGSWLLFGAAPANAANSELSLTNYSFVALSDFRIYDTALSSTQLLSITSGDWDDVC